MPECLYHQDFNQQKALQHVSGGDGDGQPGTCVLSHERAASWVEPLFYYVFEA